MPTLDSFLAAADSAWRQGRAPKAVQFYRRVLQMDASHPLALRRLAWLEEDAGHLQHAAELHRRLVVVQPNDAMAHQDLGLCLKKLGQSAQALAELRLATEVDPHYAPAFCNLGLALEDAGDVHGAIAALGIAVALQPDSDFIRYHLAALGGAAPPAACPADYLVKLFDDYSRRFDEHLFKTLSYQGPQLLGQIVGEHAKCKSWDVMDLGCGTGMSALPFRDAARSIIGVDLSGQMLNVARRRTTPAGKAVYDSLIQSDIVRALQLQSNSIDLILAADVFIYVGDLATTFASAAAALRTGGLFAFTTESCIEAEDFRLNTTRRYSHSPAYICRLAADRRFNMIAQKQAFLRFGNHAERIVGDVYLLQKPAEPHDTGATAD